MYFRVYGDSAEIGAATARQFPRAILNSFIIGGTVMFINLFFGSLAAYALARMNFGGNLALLLFYLGSRSVPGVAIMIPMYLVMRSYGLLDTHVRGYPRPCNLYAAVHYLDPQGLFPDRATRFGTCRAGRWLLPSRCTVPCVFASDDARHDRGGHFLLHLIVGRIFLCPFVYLYYIFKTCDCGGIRLRAGATDRLHNYCRRWGFGGATPDHPRIHLPTIHHSRHWRCGDGIALHKGRKIAVDTPVTNSV